MRALDTNALVRLIVRDDERQFREAEQFVAGGAWVSTVALAETAWVLISIYGFRSRTLAQTIRMLIKQPSLSFQDAVAVESALELFVSNPSVEFSDCLILELARKNGHLPLGTFDRKLARLSGVQEI